MKDFLFYGAFNDSRDFYTLFAGVRILNADVIKSVLQTDDFSKNQRIMISGSGVNQIDLSLSGVLENQQFFKTVLTDFLINGTIFPGRLQNKEYTISGNWIITRFALSDPYSNESNFEMEIKNSGEFKIQ